MFWSTSGNYAGLRRLCWTVLKLHVHSYIIIPMLQLCNKQTKVIKMYFGTDIVNENKNQVTFVCSAPIIHGYLFLRWAGLTDYMINSFNQWFAPMGEHQEVRSMMYETFMYWLKHLTPRVDIVDIRKGLCWPMTGEIVDAGNRGCWGGWGTCLGLLGHCLLWFEPSKAFMPKGARVSSLHIHVVPCFHGCPCHPDFGGWAWQTQGLVSAILVMCTEMEANICGTLLNSWASGSTPAYAMINAQEMLKSSSKGVSGSAQDIDVCLLSTWSVH